MIKLVGDSDGEVKVVSSFWEGEVYLPLEKALEYVSMKIFIPINSHIAVAIEGVGGFKKYIKEETLKRDNYTCVFCGEPAAHTFRPNNYRLGGKRISLANSVACCHSCSTEQNNIQVKNSPELRNEKTLQVIKEQLRIERELWKEYCVKFNKKYRKNKSFENLKMPPNFKDIIVEDTNMNEYKNNPVKPNSSFRTGVLYTDASLKDGESTLATVIYQNDKIIYKSFQIVETGNINLAEAEAILAGIKIAETMNIRITHLYTDSMNVADAVNKNQAATKNITIKDLVMEIKGLVKRHNLKVNWIPRNQNKVADQVSKRVLEAI